MKTKLLLCILVSTIILQSCSKDPDPGESDNGSFYFTGTINSQNVNYTATETGEYGCGVSAPGAEIGDQYDLYKGTVIQKMTDDKNSIYVHILKRFSGAYPTMDQMFAMFHLGSYGYGLSNIGGTTTNGASISYIDNNGKEWSTEGGSQAGSTFSISEVADNNDGTSKKIFTATFSCKLYNGASVLTLTNGKIRGKAFFP